jgi:nucleoside-diphosphate-sugar epimerase
MKKILVTGDKGYIGTILTEILISNGYEVEGLDIGYFEDCKF